VLQLLNDCPEGDPAEGSVAAKCELCNEAFTAARYLYTHLSDTHFQEALDKDLPKRAPWKCPKCSYTGNDPRALRIHYGVRHKVARQMLAEKLGVSLTAAKKQQVGRGKINPQLGTCAFCTMQFKTEEDKTKHLVLHLSVMLYEMLPEQTPFKCPRCEETCVTRRQLLLHFGLSHVEVVHELLARDHSTLTVDMSVAAEEGTSGGAGGSPKKLTEGPLPPHKAMAEEKRFPKCRICRYRYFSRLDLCRHFVDNHLRERLSAQMDETSTECPVCHMQLENQQTRLRHLVWSHQNLEVLVQEHFQVEFLQFKRIESQYWVAPMVHNDTSIVQSGVIFQFCNYYNIKAT
jgi:hypothetical protein